MKIAQLKYFITTARLQNITKAAQELFISPQALSKRIQTLEEELGAELFERSHGKIVLSPVGVLVHDEAVKMVAEFDRGADRIAGLVARDKGGVTLVCADSCLGALKDNPVDLFGRQYGGKVEVLHMRDVLAEDYIVRHSIDFGLTTTPMTGTGYNSTLLCRWKYCLMVRNDHPLRNRKSLRLADLTGYTLQAKNRLYTSYHTIKNRAEAQGLNLSFNVLDSDFIGFRTLLLNTDTVGVGVEFIPTGDYFTIIPLEDELYWELYLVTKKDAKFTYLPQKMIDTILRCRVE